MWKVMQRGHILPQVQQLGVVETVWGVLEDNIGLSQLQVLQLEC